MPPAHFSPSLYRGGSTKKSHTTCSWEDPEGKCTYKAWIPRGRNPHKMNLSTYILWVVLLLYHHQVFFVDFPSTLIYPLFIISRLCFVCHCLCFVYMLHSIFNPFYLMPKV